MGRTPIKIMKNSATYSILNQNTLFIHKGKLFVAAVSNKYQIKTNHTKTPPSIIKAIIVTGT